jgi:hypothetical protein
LIRFTEYKFLIATDPDTIFTFKKYCDKNVV